MVTRGTPCRDTSSSNHDKGHLAGIPRPIMMTRGTSRHAFISSRDGSGGHILKCVRHGGRDSI
ncbi:hypothetical protein Taro_029317 [Colocasia esculenta]|uniref:Uncharacterized protein n=1 Tax=Colocasia esculenta TaxID=4460 RepID=A0A843VNQ1_COLES|nr:hypothetical protein [Colocasia esculenta]